MNFRISGFPSNLPLKNWLKNGPFIPSERAYLLPRLLLHLHFYPNFGRKISLKTVSMIFLRLFFIQSASELHESSSCVFNGYKKLSWFPRKIVVIYEYKIYIDHDKKKIPILVQANILNLKLKVYLSFGSRMGSFN